MLLLTFMSGDYLMTCYEAIISFFIDSLHVYGYHMLDEEYIRQSS